MDVMRDNARPSDGLSHVVHRIRGHYMGVEIRDFGIGKMGEGFWRPEFEDVDDTDEAMAMVRRRA